MTDVKSADYGVLSDASFARAKQRIGIPQRLPNPPHNFEVTWDGSRQFAYGYGDDNPLYCDPEYAAETRWGNLIAAPTFIRSSVPLPGHRPICHFVRTAPSRSGVRRRHRVEVVKPRLSGTLTRHR